MMIHLFKVLLFSALWPLVRARHNDGPSAIYFATNGESNEIVAVNVNQDGTLGTEQSTQTGGSGSQGFITSVNAPAGPDALFSQGSLAIHDFIIGAVNAGSNTLSLFSIDPNSPTNLHPIGNADTRGDFPNTLAFHPKLPILCVGNSGARAGVSCFEYWENGIVSLGSLKTLELGQSTPPTGPTTSTISQLIFSEDGHTLSALVKFNGTAGDNAKIYSYQVDSNGNVGDKSVESVMQNSTAIFGASIIAKTGGKELYVTDPSVDSYLAEFDPVSEEFKTSSIVPIPGAIAPCWTFYSQASSSAFVGDVGLARFVEVTFSQDGSSPPTGQIANIYNVTEGANQGVTDLSGKDGFVYGLSPGQSANAPVQVYVFDSNPGAGKGKVIQVYTSSVLGITAEGMAVL
jgi:hypothetical protein